MIYRMLLTVVVGVALGFGVVLAADLRPAHAFTNDPNRVTSQEEKQFRIKKYLMRSQPGTVGGTATSEAQAGANREVLSKSARKLPSLKSGLLLRGGLAGVAAGVWIHNGISLWNATQCGETSCPPPLVLDAEFRQAQETAESIGAGGSIVKSVYGGSVKAEGMITRVRIDYSGGTVSSSWTWVGEVEPTWGDYKTIGSWGCETVSGGGAGCAGPGMTAMHVRSGEATATAVSDAGTGTSRLFTQDWDNNSATVEAPRYFGPEVRGGESVDWENPVFDVGTVTAVEAPPATTHQYSPAESDQFYNDIKDQTCTPTAPAETTPEVCPDHFPQEWEEEFPDINQPGKQDDPYGDPDKDGDPNHSDPDDDDDGTPDEQDDEPYVMPPTAPNADPDEDGEPNKDDTDDDGDGIPDEDDPQPHTPTDPGTLPEDHPYADPDKDGTPNRSDPDDDNDGYPDESDPAPHNPNEPGPDTDGDGDPDSSDPDDDGDGVPDTEDPAPKDPNVPGEDPDADSDGDGVPNKIDPEPSNPAEPAPYRRLDTDGDGSPDPYDPAPEDPADPAGGPSGNPDGDGSPNRHDPYPNNPSRPADGPDQDLDEDGTPNRNDPDPYRPAEPTGGPSGDMDQDGTPNAQDPAPDDPSEPTDRSESCPVAREASFDMPKVELGSVFPFSLILWTWDALGDLSAPPKSPSFSLGMFGTISVPESASDAMSIVRGCIGFVAVLGMMLWFYRYISGKGSNA